MMNRRRNHKTIFYYLLRLAIALGIVGGLIYYVQRWYADQQTLPIAQILENSPLKNRTFAAQVQQVQNNNLHAYLLEEHSNPIVSISFAFQNTGTAYEPEDKAGLALMLSEMLTAGGGKYDAQTFKQTCAEYGIKIAFSTNMDSFNGTLQFPKEFASKAVELFNAVLYDPRMEESYWQLTKNQQLLALQLEQERPQAVLKDKFKKYIFAGHPYERNILGNEQSVQNISIDDLQNYRMEKFGQDNLLVGMAGDIDTTEAVDLLQKLFARLPRKVATERLSVIDITTNGASENITRDTPQTVVQFAAQGTFRNSLDFYPLYLVNYIFGGSGLNSRLNKHIREKEGLTYGIYTYLNINQAAGLISGGFSATPENFIKAVNLLYEEWQKLGKNGITESELEQAKKALIASYNLRFASTAGIADMLLAMQQYNLGADFLQKRNSYIQEVTLPEANAAAKKYFNTAPDLMYIGVIDNGEKK